MNDDSDVSGGADIDRDIEPDVAEQIADVEQAIADVRARVADVPAEVVVTNHAVGLYELAAIHLTSVPPDLHAASLAIDALGFLVDGLGERLGDEHTTMRDALANIRLAFVSASSQSG